MEESFNAMSISLGLGLLLSIRVLKVRCFGRFQYRKDTQSLIFCMKFSLIDMTRQKKFTLEKLV